MRKHLACFALILVGGCSGDSGPSLDSSNGPPYSDGSVLSASIVNGPQGQYGALLDKGEDRNSNGVIDLDEFVRAVAQMCPKVEGGAGVQFRELCTSGADYDTEEEIRNYMFATRETMWYVQVNWVVQEVAERLPEDRWIGVTFVGYEAEDRFYFFLRDPPSLYWDLVTIVVEIARLYR